MDNTALPPLRSTNRVASRLDFQLTRRHESRGFGRLDQPPDHVSAVLAVELIRCLTPQLGVQHRLL